MGAFLRTPSLPLLGGGDPAVPGVLGELLGTLGKTLQNLLRRGTGPDTVSLSVLAMGEGREAAVGGCNYRRGTALARTSGRSSIQCDSQVSRLNSKKVLDNVSKV